MVTTPSPHHSTQKPPINMPEIPHVLSTFDLTGRVALVTGGSRGLGFAIARALGQAGASVAVTARAADRADEAASALRAEGLSIIGAAVEVSDQDAVSDCLAAVESELGGVDILVNNAGVSLGAAALDVTDEDWRAVFATNVDGVWHCSRAVARSMQNRGGGSIINVGSISATIVNRPRWQPGYLASKAAVHQLTKGLAVEWAPHDIRVNAIAPGYFLTEMSPVDQPQYRPWCIDPTPLHRWGEPHELGPLAVYLAGNASRFMTGSVLTIDGGYTLY